MVVCWSPKIVQCWSPKTVQCPDHATSICTIVCFIQIDCIIFHTLIFRMKAVDPFHGSYKGWGSTVLWLISYCHILHTHHLLHVIIELEKGTVGVRFMMLTNAYTAILHESFIASAYKRAKGVCTGRVLWTGSIDLTFIHICKELITVRLSSDCYTPDKFHIHPHLQ